MHVQQTPAVIEALQVLSHRIYRVYLRPLEAVNFQAGQYLEIGLSATHWVPFSIASTPRSPLIELHIQHWPERPSSQQLHQQLKIGASLMLRLAFGECQLPQKEAPLLLIAAGTGFSQMKALIEASFERGWQAPLTLYWAARTREGLYALDQALAWAEQQPHFQCIPCVETIETIQTSDQADPCRQGALLTVLAEDFVDPESAQGVKGFISGSPAMVYAVEDFMMQRGLARAALLSDAHAYAPRS